MTKYILLHTLNTQEPNSPSPGLHNSPLPYCNSTLAANAQKLACLLRMQTRRQKKLKWAGRLRPCLPHAFSFPLHPPPVSRRVAESARAKGVSHSHKRVIHQSHTLSVTVTAAQHKKTTQERPDSYTPSLHYRYKSIRLSLGSYYPYRSQERRLKASRLGGCAVRTKPSFRKSRRDQGICAYSTLLSNVKHALVCVHRSHYVYPW
jgi:hypothetical protein